MINKYLSFQLAVRGIHEKRVSNYSKAIEYYELSYVLDKDDPDPIRSMGKTYHLTEEYLYSITSYQVFIYSTFVKLEKDNRIKLHLSIPEYEEDYHARINNNTSSHIGASILAYACKILPSYKNLYLKELNDYRTSLQGNPFSDSHNNDCPVKPVGSNVIDKDMLVKHEEVLKVINLCENYKGIDFYDFCIFLGVTYINNLDWMKDMPIRQLQYIK